MSKSVILITITGMLWAASASAQAQNPGREPAAGIGPSASNVLFVAIPSVGALNRQLTIPAARSPDLAAAPNGLAAATSGLAGTARDFTGAIPALPVTAPGVAAATKEFSGVALSHEKPAKEAASRIVSRAVDLQRQQPHHKPTCN